MNKLIQFLKECKDEMVEHVTWTKYKELQSHTVLVLVASLIFAVVIALIDFSFDRVLKALYESF
ncbi:MAG: preprotein translocase subunit SecE [Thermoflexibacter sp.]|jgi:preprotein translocase subunit SecE|nr:preprotein translocase subunit SecE [Thermoflexibacter sp.]